MHRTAPCKTFAGAISKTAINGEINCLDPGGFGAVTITKSITIDCHEISASILNSGTNGVNVPFDSFNAADVRKTVRLRNINFNGVDTSVNGIRITGGAVITAGVVIVEDCLIDGNFAGNARGISDERVNGRELYVANTTIRNTGSVGILAAVEANFSNSAVSNNVTGILNSGGTTTIRLNNNDISFNGTAITGATQSFRNNRITGNGAAGTAPTVIGATSDPSGMQ
jgi:hypothetical protein